VGWIAFSVLYSYPLQQYDRFGIYLAACPRAYSLRNPKTTPSLAYACHTLGWLLYHSWNCVPGSGSHLRHQLQNSKLKKSVAAVFHLIPGITFDVLQNVIIIRSRVICNLSGDLVAEISLIGTQNLDTHTHTHITFLSPLSVAHTKCLETWSPWPRVTVWEIRYYLTKKML
jgi:hypothetical protein